MIVLGLPRRGVPVAAEVKKALNAPLDVFLVRKLGAPGQEALAMGAIASAGVRVLNQEVIRMWNGPQKMIDDVAAKERAEMARRERSFGGDRPRPSLRGRTVILVDDGLATGASMRAAVAGLRAHEPGHVVVAVPTAAPETCAAFEKAVDETVGEFLQRLAPFSDRSIGVIHVL